MVENTTKLLTYFRLPNESLGEFAAQLKKLTPEDKAELAEGVKALQGNVEATDTDESEA